MILLIFAICSIKTYQIWNATPVNERQSVRTNVVSVEVETVSYGVARAAVSATGSVQGVQEANISANATGRIEYLAVNDGDYVEQGQMLARIDARELEAQYMQTKAAVVSAQANLANTALIHTRMQALVQQGAVSQQQLDNAQTQYDMAQAQATQNRADVQLLEAQIANTVVKAPFGGYVARRALSQGEMVSPGAVLLALVDLSKVKIEAAVSEQDIGRIRPGQAATFTVDAYPAQVFAGKVTEISPAADIKSRSFKIRIEAENDEHKLKSGMFARLDLIYDQKAETLLVSKQAVVQRNGKSVVFVVNNDRVEEREIVIGLTNAHVSEVLTGLQEGEIVTTFGHEALKNGDRISIARKEGK